MGQEGERYKTILRAAISVFADKGYHGCRISDVAREAGVAYGLVYHYFKDKEQLLQSVFEVGWGGFVARVREVAESDLSLEEKVYRVVRVAFEAYRVDPKAVKVIILEIARNPTIGRVDRQSSFNEVLKISARMFEEAQQKGERSADADPRLCAAFLFGTIEMGLTAFVADLMDATDNEAVNRAQEQLTDSFLHGIFGTRAKSLTPEVDKPIGARSGRAGMR
jgi:TetR/AcrR family fatty acid metabolism transcriptional regulator